MTEHIDYTELFDTFLKKYHKKRQFMQELPYFYKRHSTTEKIPDKKDMFKLFTTTYTPSYFVFFGTILFHAGWQELHKKWLEVLENLKET